MVKNKAINESAYISELAIHGIQEKKGNDIVRLDLRNVNVVIHVFRTDKREYYGVEDLWGDAEIKSYKSA
jgi:ribosome-associated protein